MNPARLTQVLYAAALCAGLLLTPVFVSGADFEESSPPSGSHHAQSGKVITRFSENMLAPGATDFVAHGRYSGKIDGHFTGVGTNELAFSPAMELPAGEVVEITLGAGMLDAQNNPLTNPTVLRYTVASKRTGMYFTLGQNIGGSGHTSSKLADMNGDGWLDYVTPSSNSLSIHLNNGGTFSATPIVPPPTVSGLCNDFGILDINNDGALDLVRTTIQNQAQTAYWIQDPQTGAFAGPTHFGEVAGGSAYGPSNAIGWPQAVSVGDVNGDGFQDVVVGTNGISILYINDQGNGFITSNNLLPGPVLDCELADLDNDGDLDFLYGEMGGGFFSLNDGNGQFWFGGGLGSTGVRHGCMTTGDMNGDGWLDIIVGYEGNIQAPRIHWNDGTGHFYTHTELGTRVENVYTVEVADFNGDGHLDVIAMDDTAFMNYEPTQIFVNDGTGDFSQIVHASGNSTGGGTGPGSNRGAWTHPVWGTVGDIDNDRDLDIVGMSFAGFSTYVWRNEGTGVYANFSSPAGGSVNVARNTDIEAWFSGPMNQPATGEFVARTSLGGPVAGSPIASGSSISLTPGAPLRANEEVEITLADDLAGVDGNFSGPHVYRFRTESVAGPGYFNVITQDFGGLSATTCVAAGDLNQDGLLDLVEGVDNGAIQLHLNSSAGFVSTNVGAAANTSALALADMNGDGWVDLVSVDNGGQNRVALWDPVSVAFGAEVNFGSGSDSTTSLALGDLNGDGFADVVIGNSGEECAVFLNDGAGNLQQVWSFGDANDVIRAVAIVDLDNDGALDVVTGGDAVHVRGYFNTGDGRVPLERELTANPVDVNALTTGDLNSDRAADIIAALGAGADLALINDTTGRFAREVTIGATGNTKALDLGDIDGDGDLDMLAGTANASVLFTNDGSGNFTQLLSYPAGGNPASVLMLDMDNDGDLELVVGRNGALNQVMFNEVTPPTFTSTPVVVATAGMPYSYTATAVGGPPAPTLSVGSLPAWLTFDRNTGVLSGTPGAADIGLSATITITASNGTPPDAQQSFQIDVLGTPAQIVSNPVTSVVAGGNYHYAVTTLGLPAATYTSSALPAWLSLDPVNGELVGTPMPGETGTVTVTITADNGWGTDSQTFNIVVLEDGDMGGAGNAASGGCAATSNGSALWLIMLGLMLGCALYVRRKRTS